jgi:protein gp37
MGENSKIEWTDHTFNPWRGCSKVSAGCANCYAEAMSRRNPAVLGEWGPGGTRIVAAERTWLQPLAWNRRCQQQKRRARVFCASLADVFEDRPDLIEPRERLLWTIYCTPALDWLLLTKRPENIVRLISAASQCKKPIWAENLSVGNKALQNLFEHSEEWLGGKPPANVWIGTSVENQAAADKRIPELLQVPARVRFLSCEPLLGPVSLTAYKCGEGPWDGGWTLMGNCLRGFRSTSPNSGAETAKVDWVIAGGESGPNARPSHPDWFRSLRDQCQAAGTPFFFKQWGEWAEDVGQVNERGRDPWPHTWITDDGHEWNCHNIGRICMRRMGKNAAGCLLDGRDWKETPQ